MATVLKTVDPQGSVSSNLTASTNLLDILFNSCIIIYATVSGIWQTSRCAHSTEWGRGDESNSQPLQVQALPVVPILGDVAEWPKAAGC